MPDLQQLASALAGTEEKNAAIRPTAGDVKAAVNLKRSQPKDRFLYQIGDSVYWMEVWFWSGMSGYEPYPIPAAVIQQLVIEESLLSWSVTGYIVLESQHESLFRGINDYDRFMSAPMVLRSDGRNRISIKIAPYMEDVARNVELDPKLWEMQFDCVIYDTQDSTSNDAVMRYKTLYFKDERHQIFLERNVEWTTSTQFYKKDSERGLKGTVAIANLINAVGQSAGSAAAVNVGYTEEGAINTPDIPFSNIDLKRWDAGHESNKIFNTSAANHNALQDLNHLLQNTISSDRFPVILSMGRNSYDKYWRLLSLSYYYKNASKFQIETLIIDDGLENTTPRIPRGPDINSTTSTNFISKEASIITNYNFVPMSPVDDLDIVNKPVVKFNFEKCQYEISMVANTAENLRNKIKDLSKGLYSTSDEVEGQVLLNVNRTKLAGLATKPIFSPLTYTPNDIGLMEMVKDITFLGNALYFETKGLTFRTPGKFINLERHQYDQNPFDNQLLGQWLLTRVVHSFSKGVYKNNIWCNRFDAAGVVLKKDIAPS
jgi:hypothetical protein